MELETGVQVAKTDLGQLLLYVKQAIGFTAAQARELAAALTEYADSVDPPPRAERRRKLRR